MHRWIAGFLFLASACGGEITAEARLRGEAMPERALLGGVVLDDGAVVEFYEEAGGELVWSVDVETADDAQMSSLRRVEKLFDQDDSMVDVYELLAKDKAPEAMVIAYANHLERIEVDDLSGPEPELPADERQEASPVGMIPLMSSSDFDRAYCARGWSPEYCWLRKGWAWALRKYRKKQRTVVNYYAGAADWIRFAHKRNRNAAAQVACSGRWNSYWTVDRDHTRAILSTGRSRARHTCVNFGVPSVKTGVAFHAYAGFSR